MINDDMFSFKDGLGRERTKDSIKLNKYLNLKELKIPQNFQQRKIKLSSEQNIYKQEIKKISSGVMTYAQKIGSFNHTFQTAIYEAISNAWQHGNRLDSSKNLILAKFATPNSLEVIISDEAEELPKDFQPFIETVKKSEGGFIDWYNFSDNAIRCEGRNYGTGTSFMHMYSDEVKYFKSKDTRGLALYLKINSQ